MKDFGSFDIFMPTKIVFGVGRISEIGKLVSDIGRKAFIVTGKKSAKESGLLEKVVSLLKGSGIDSVIFDKIMPNPVSTVVDEGVELIKREGCDFVVGLGGGSPIDSAKLMAMTVVSGGSCWDYTNVGGNKRPTGALPVVAIPTTHGTGTEADPFAVVTNPDTHEKVGVGFNVIFPKLSLVDPQVMVTLSPEQTAATSMDAFYHAIESYLNVRHQPVSDLLALQAISLIAYYLPGAYRNGDDIKARTALAWASTAAGICESLSGCIANHSLEHPLSGFYNITHGVGLCATGPAFLRYIRPYVKDRLAKVAIAMGVPEIISDVEELSKLAIDFVVRLQRSVNLDITLKDIGVEYVDLDMLAEEAMRTMGELVKVTPGNLSVEDLRKIYEESF